MGTIKKAIYYPTQDAQVAPYYKNAYTQLDTGGLATKYGIIPATMTIIQGHNTNIPTVISKANTDKQVSKESNKLKNEELERAKKAIMPIFEAIQAAPNFDEADAELLGIRRAKVPVDYDSVVPEVTKVTNLPDKVIIDWIKGFLDGVIIECSYDNLVWAEIGRVMKSPFEDTRKNKVAHTPEIRYYRLRYFKNDRPVGQYCDVVKVTCDIE
jgi:hypothetical protein